MLNRTYKLYLAALLVTGAVLTGCSKSFLDRQPTDAVPEEDIYNTVSDVQTVVNGTWGYLMDTYFTFANPGYSAILRTSDAMGNDVAVLTSKYGYPNAYQFLDVADKTVRRTEYFWTMLYKVIDNCNNVIAKVDAVEGDATEKKYLKGQALALRAHCYLTLATFYSFSIAKDPNARVVPIYTEPTTGTTQGAPRATISALYTQVLNDLTGADTLLVGFTREAAAKYKMTKDVVDGLLARTYLATGRWKEAAAKAAEARAAYSLMPPDEYYKGFNNVSNVEWIWGHPQRPDQSTASYSFHFLDVSSPGSYYYSFMADPFFKDLFEPADIRYRLFEWDTLPGREGLLRYKKFLFRDDMTGDIVLMRASEMYLIEAEAYAQDGNLPKAIERLNELRTARHATLLGAGASRAAILEEVWKERRKELWGEGFALADIIRTQRSVERKPYVNAQGDEITVQVPRADGTFKTVTARGHTALRFPDGSAFRPNSPYYLFTIPDAEIKNNPNLDK